MTQEGITSGRDELSEWLTHYGLAKYDAALREAGLDQFALIKSLDDDLIDDIVKEAQLKILHKTILLKAVKAVKFGSYGPAKPPSPPFDTDEFKQGIDEELVKLRQSRQHFEGYIERQKDIENVGDGTKTRTIIFIGQTGAGKTTLINSMCNYLHKVSYREPFRYKLICEEKNDKISKDDTKSKTRDITSYHLRSLPAINHTLNVIDTPGFGDTDGPKKDMFIRTQFKKFFEKIPYIDAIYFVVKSSETKLGATQRYIFNMVLDLFGENVKNNIFILFTFSDGAKPPALKAVNGLQIPYSGYFQINNSGFGLPGVDDGPTHEMFFHLGMTQFKIIFDALSEVQTVSTQLTVQTLKERDNITNWLFEIGQEVKTALDKISKAHETHDYLEAHMNKMDANEDFKVPDFEIIVHRDKCNHYTTYCIVCINTCHTNCGILNDADKSECWAMTDGYCTQCKGKCEWMKHVNRGYVIRRENKQIWRTKQEMFNRFNLAKKETANCKSLMTALMEDINERENKIRQTIIKMKQSVNRLKQIALNKNVLTDDQYFDTLIEGQKQEGRKGWKNRVKQLESMKRDNRLLRNVTMGKAPISWNEDQDLRKYQQKFLNNNDNDNDKKQSGTIKIGIPYTEKQVVISINSKK